MAIQISTDKLSGEAKAVLDNTKNKSQFMRDAIEFYVSNRSIKDDLDEIKAVLRQIAENKITSFDNSQIQEIRVKAVPETIEPTYQVTPKKDNTPAISNTANVNQIMTDIKEVETNDEMEDLIDNSLNMF